MVRGICNDPKKEAIRKYKISIKKVGKLNAFYGKHHSKETKQRWSEQRKKLIGKLNHFYGKKHTEEQKKIWSDMKKLDSPRGKKHPGWKGNSASIEEFHAYLRKIKPIPSKCENCKKEAKKLDLALRDHSATQNEKWKYTRDISDYVYICRKCHTELDGRTKRMLVAASSLIFERNKKGRFIGAHY